MSTILSPVGAWNSQGVADPLAAYPWNIRLESENALNTSGNPCSNGEDCEEIPDIGLNENHVTQQTAPAKRPVFRASDTYLEFSGTKEMTFTDVVGTPAFTIFVVYQSSASITSSSNQCLLGPDTATDKGYIYFGDATSRLTNETVSLLNPNATDTYGVGITSTVNTDKHIMTFRLSGTTEAIWVDQTPQSLITSSAGGLNGTSGLYPKNIKRLGSNNGLALIDGNFYGLFIVEYAMDNTTVAEVQQLLTDKYGI